MSHAKDQPYTVRFASPAKALRAVECLDACANLPEPEKNIRELVAASRGLARSYHHWACHDDERNPSHKCWDAHKNALKVLALFKEKKNERPLD